LDTIDFGVVTCRLSGEEDCWAINKVHKKKVKNDGNRNMRTFIRMISSFSRLLTLRCRSEKGEEMPRERLLYPTPDSDLLVTRSLEEIPLACQINSPQARIADSSSRNAVSFSSSRTTKRFPARRDAQQQRRSFVRWNQRLTRSPNPNRLF
jgi:hypothetical protein